MSVNVLITGDGHSGSVSGILGPEFGWNDNLKDKQALLWGWYLNALRENGPWDILLGMGDAVDGEGKKESLGTLINDTLEQARAAEEVYAATGIRGENMYLVNGTSFHSVGTYNYEAPLATALGASLLDEHYLDIHGLTIHTRHNVGRSDIPYGQGTPLLKESVRDLVTAILADEAPADIVIRGHTHMSLRMSIGNRTAINSPCMQYPNTVYGRQCRSFYYDMGIGKLTIRSKNDWEYKAILMPLKIVRPRNYTVVQ